MDQINILAKKHNLFIVEDAACGFGSRIQGKHVGLFGDTGCFSFHPRKAITTGEGGMITTNNDSLANKLRILRDHGASKTDLQRHLGAKPYLLSDHPKAGYNFRLTDIQAVLGSSQMKRADEICSERGRLAKNYHDSLKGLKDLRVTKPEKDLIHGYQSYACLFQPDKVKLAIQKKDKDLIETIGKERNVFMEYLQEQGISTRPSTHAVHMLTYYKYKYKKESINYPESYAANNCSISLPLFHGMKDSEQSYIIEKIKQKL